MRQKKKKKEKKIGLAEVKLKNCQGKGLTEIWMEDRASLVLGQ